MICTVKIILFGRKSKGEGEQELLNVGHKYPDAQSQAA